MHASFTSRFPVKCRQTLVTLADHCITQHGIPAYVAQTGRQCWLASDDTITGLSDNYPLSIALMNATPEQRLYCALADLGRDSDTNIIEFWKANAGPRPANRRTYIIPSEGLPVVFTPMELPAAVREEVLDAHLLDEITKEVTQLLKEEHELDEKGINPAPLCGMTKAAAILAEPIELRRLANHILDECKPTRERIIVKMADYYEEQDSYREE